MNPTALTDLERRRGLAVLLVSTFLMWAGFFMIIPLIAIHYVDGLGWAAGTIGIVLAVRQLCQQGLTVLGGMFADRFGVKGLICLGLAVRTVGFASMAFADTFPLLLLSAVLAALGGALFDSPGSAAAAALTTEENRSRFYSLRGVISSLGMTVGPLLGAVLLRYNFASLALFAASIYALIFAITAALMPTVRVAVGGRSLTYGLRLALRDRPFIAVTVLLMGFWFMWVQLSIALPLEATAIAGTADAVSWVYALNAALSITLQYPVLRLLERSLSARSILVIGMLVMASGIALVALVGSTAGLLACVAVFSFGAMLATPTQQTLITELADQEALGSYFGVSALALGIGGALGNYSGGALYGYAQQVGAPMLPWLVFGSVGGVAAVGIWLQGQVLARRMPVAAAQTR